MTSKPLDRRTRAILRSAELGFLGVVVFTTVHTPRRKGLPFRAGTLLFFARVVRPLRSSCWVVGRVNHSLCSRWRARHGARRSCGEGVWAQGWPGWTRVWGLPAHAAGIVLAGSRLGWRWCSEVITGLLLHVPQHGGVERSELAE